MTNPKTKGRGKNYRWLADHVSYTGDDCLAWPFGKSNGYGIFSFNGKMQWAHRFMCELVHGPCPGTNYHAAHSCGRGHLGCINPRHLSWQTISQNALDRTKHGTRNVWGSKGKLSEAQASEIRALRGKISQYEIGKLYGVCSATISAVQLGKSWTGERKYRSISDEENSNLLAEIDKPLDFLVEKYGLARSAIYRRRVKARRGT